MMPRRERTSGRPELDAYRTYRARSVRRLVCGKKDGQLCKRLTIKNVGKVARDHDFAFERLRCGELLVVDTKALEAIATLAVRATSFEPVPGIAHVRNESKRTVTKLGISAYSWKRGEEGVLTKLGGYAFSGMNLTPPLRPGEERDIDLSGGKKDEYAKPGVVAHTVVATSVAYDDGVFVFNENTEAHVSERAAEDVKAAR